MWVLYNVTTILLHLRMGWLVVQTVPWLVSFGSCWAVLRPCTHCVHGWGLTNCWLIMGLISSPYSSPTCQTLAELAQPEPGLG